MSGPDRETDGERKRHLESAGHVPRTSSRAGLEVSASWRVKSPGVTWHSQRPSSKSRLALLTRREQSPSRVPAHSYLSGCMPTGFRSFCQMHWPRLSWTRQRSLASSPWDTSWYWAGVSAKRCSMARPSPQTSRRSGSHLAHLEAGIFDSRQLSRVIRTGGLAGPRPGPYRRPPAGRPPDILRSPAPDGWREARVWRVTRPRRGPGESASDRNRAATFTRVPWETASGAAAAAATRGRRRRRRRRRRRGRGRERHDGPDYYGAALALILRRFSKVGLDYHRRRSAAGDWTRTRTGTLLDAWHRSRGRRGSARPGRASRRRLFGRGRHRRAPFRKPLREGEEPANPRAARPRAAIDARGRTAEPTPSDPAAIRPRELPPPRRPAAAAELLGPLLWAASDFHNCAIERERCGRAPPQRWPAIKGKSRRSKA
jgi:hypothetical protein